MKLNAKALLGATALALIAGSASAADLACLILRESVDHARTRRAASQQALNALHRAVARSLPKGRRCTKLGEVCNRLLNLLRISPGRQPLQDRLANIG